MDDMQRYREIRDNADPEDPMGKLRAYLTVAFDQALAEAIQLERQGKSGKVRALGFTATADLLENTPAVAGRCGDIAPSLALLSNRVRQTCCLTAGHAGWHKGDDGSEWSWHDDADQTATAPR